MVTETANLLLVQKGGLAFAQLGQQVVYAVGQLLVVSTLQHQDLVRPTLDLKQVLNLLLMDLTVDNGRRFARLDELFRSLALNQSRGQGTGTARQVERSGDHY